MIPKKPSGGLNLASRHKINKKTDQRIEMNKNQGFFILTNLGGGNCAIVSPISHIIK
jgi:hypothetical protein